MNNSPKNLSPIMRLACVLVRCNPDLLAFRLGRIATGRLPRLLLLSVVRGCHWARLDRLSGRSLSLCRRLPWRAGLRFYVLDRSGYRSGGLASDGVLRQPGARRRWWEHGRLAMRLAMDRGPLDGHFNRRIDGDVS